MLGGKTVIHAQRSTTINSGYSADGISNPLLSYGSTGQWDANRVLEPYVFEEDGIYYMFYMGETVTTLIETVGYATALSPEGPFTKYTGNPILSGDSPSGWDAGQDKAADPYVFKVNSTYYIGVSATPTGKGAGGAQVGFFKSVDLVTFEEVPYNPIVSLGSGWDASFVARGAVTEVGGVYYASYMGNGGVGITTLQVNPASWNRVDPHKWRFSSSNVQQGSGVLTTPSSYVESITTFGQNYSVRSRSKLHATSQSIFGFRDLPSGTELLEIIANYPSANNVRAYQSTGTPVGSDDLANPNVYATYEITRNGSTSGIYFINDTQVVELTTQVPSTSLPVVLFQGIETDWVFVRKYAASAPSVSVGSEVTLIQPTPALSSGAAPACNDTTPVLAPWLYSATTKSSGSVMLKFGEVLANVDHYALEYGTESGKYIFGAENIGGGGTKEYLVQSLSPGTKYYFRVRAGNGCATGPWSSEISATTSRRGYFGVPLITGTNLETEIIETETVEKEEETQTEGYDVTVKVIDEKEKPVEGARVEIHSEVKSATTDKDGVATFENIPPGEHQILIAYNNQQGEQNINLTGDTIQEFKFTIQISPTSPFRDLRVVGIIGALTITTLFLIILRKKDKRALQ